MGVIREADFRPAWWMKSAHMQTLWGPLKRRLPEIDRRTERLQLADGDHLQLDWAGPQGVGSGVIVILLHGLAGCSDSHYIRGIQASLVAAGIGSVAINSRGARQPNSTALGYHAGEIDDVDAVIEHVYRRHPAANLLAIGVSLGGSRLLNWLARRDSGKLTAVASVCAPLRLDLCANRLDHGLSQVYRRHLIKQLMGQLHTKKRYLNDHFPHQAARLNALDISDIESFWDYDDQVIAPLYDFRSAGDYYQRCSAGPQLHHIRSPALILHAKDDPFMTPDVIPQHKDLSPTVQLEISRHGGHVGFVSAGPQPYWLEQRMLRFVRDSLPEELRSAYRFDVALNARSSLPSSSGTKGSAA